MNFYCYLKVDEFGHCYPQFVNFFEASVETITRCDAKSPRFHAFLKINQAKKECGRQTLAELLINPVQRIPRIILLLQGDLRRCHNAIVSCAAFPCTGFGLKVGYHAV